MSGYLENQRILPLFFSTIGKVSRALFWKANILLLLLYFAFVVCLLISGIILKTSSDTDVAILFLGVSIYWYAAFALTVKRLHDINWSGWLAIPVMCTGILWIIIGFIEGKTKGINIQLISPQNDDGNEGSSNSLLEMISSQTTSSNYHNKNEKISKDITRKNNIDETFVNKIDKKNIEYEKEIKIEKNLSKLTKDELLNEAELGNAEAEYEMGQIYYYGDNNDEKEALRWYLKAAEQGHIEAHYQVGEIYYYGIIINEDEEEAFKWYLRAAEQGHVEAQYQVGEIYYYGISINEDKEEASKWYLKSAINNYAKAQYKIGEIYLDEDNMNQNIEEAFKWLNKAANQDYAEAQYIIGLMYKNGKGIEKDTAKALLWIKKSAEQGDSDAQYEMGEMYYHGNGVVEDDDEAFKWFSQAAEQGHLDAQNFVYAMQKSSLNQDGCALGVRARLELSKSKKLSEEMQLALQSDRYSCISESLLSNSKFSVDYQNRLLKQDRDVLWHFAINPYLTESTQMQLADNDDMYVRERIASNKNLLDKVQAKLARDLEYSVRSALAVNPSLNTNLINSLLNEQNYALAMNPNLPTKFLHQLVQSEDTMVKVCLAGNPLIFKENNLEIAKILMHDKQQDVKAALFDNENTYFIEKIVDELETLSDSKLIEGLSNGTDFYRACIAKSNMISQNIQSKLMVDKVHYVQAILASNPIISEKTQLKLVVDDEIKVLINLARNPVVTDSVQDILIKKDFDNVLCVLATNPNLSYENYEKLYNSGNKKIRKNLARNINLPEYFQLKLSDDPTRDVLINLAENPNLTEEIQLKLVDRDDMEISNNLIMNPALYDSVELKLG